MLKRSYEKIDECPERLRGMYESKDGKFVLIAEAMEVEGTVAKEKLDEFRANNIQLLKERDELKAKYKDVDPEKYNQLSAEAQKAKEAADAATEAAAKKAGEWDKLMAQRTKEEADKAKADYQKQLDTEKVVNTTLRQQLEKLAVEQAILSAATGSVQDTAVEDLLLRAKTIFTLNAEGTPIAKGPDGQVLSAADGTPLTPRSWVEQMKVKAPHLFKGSSGGGAANNASGAGGEGPNPWKKETWNLTNQGKLRRTDPEKARRLAIQAGQKPTW